MFLDPRNPDENGIFSQNRLSFSRWTDSPEGVNFFKKTAGILLPFRNLHCSFLVKNAPGVTHFRRVLSVAVIDS